MIELINTIWLSQAFGLFLWLVLAAILFAPMLAEWWRSRSDFDIFEAKNIFRLVYFLYFGLPSIYYLFFPKTFEHVNHFDNSLRVVLVFAIIGALAFHLGYKIGLPWRFSLPAGRWSGKKLLGLVAVFTVISLASFGALMDQVGGACYYFTHLGQTNEMMSGKTYFLWGILLFKTSAILLLAYLLRSKNRPWWLWFVTIFYLTATLVLVSFMGSRILAVIFVFEVLIIINYLARRINLLLLGGILVAIIVVIIGILGEFRNFSWVAPEVCQASEVEKSLEFIRQQEDEPQATISAKPTSPTASNVDSQQYIEAFGQQLEQATSDKEQLLDRYINHYFDSVRTTMMTYENTPELIRYQYGLGYAQAILQPIPGSLRPKITLPDESRSVFSEGGVYTRVQSSLAEAYTNFGWIGIILVPLAMGLLSRWVYETRGYNKQSPWSAVLYASMIGGLMIYIRGYFTGHTALFLMDLLPLLISMAIMHWPLRRSS